MKIELTSVIVDDQQKALDFYTKVLGFVKKRDVPIGRVRWLTVVSPEGSDDIELLLEPNDNPDVSKVVEAFQKALFKAGIPLTAFVVEDIHKEYERMKKVGVKFRTGPTEIKGGLTVAVFEDTCGNLIQIYQS